MVYLEVLSNRLSNLIETAERQPESEITWKTTRFCILIIFFKFKWALKLNVALVSFSVRGALTVCLRLST